jgi:hypothetical protein
VNFRNAASERARAALHHVAAGSTGPAVAPGARITLNFHPDRLVRGLPILRALAEDRTYHSQFVTGTSNGGLTAHPGGDRWRWESRAARRAARRRRRSPGRPATASREECQGRDALIDPERRTPRRAPNVSVRPSSCGQRPR